MTSWGKIYVPDTARQRPNSVTKKITVVVRRQRLLNDKFLKINNKIVATIQPAMKGTSAIMNNSARVTMGVSPNPTKNALQPFKMMANTQHHR